MARPALSRGWLANLALILAATLFAYLLAELFLFKPALRLFPARLFHHMIRELQVLGQSSKAAPLPKPGYLALFGDSHAQGKGDWFIDNGYDRNSRYHSAHLLQDALGREVLSFGRSGAGSIDGAVLEPLQTLRFLRRHGLDIPSPALALVYVYEGNDLQNNLDFVQTWAPRIIPGKDAQDPQALRLLIARLAETQASGAIRQLHDWPLLGNLLLRLTRNTLQNQFTRKYIDVEKPKNAGQTTQARVDGKIAGLPDKLQAPPLALSAEQRAFGVRIVEASLAYAKEVFTETRLVAVYIPSPLACYELTSPSASTDEENKYGIYPNAEVAVQSDALCAAVRAASKRAGIGFIDARPRLREAARQTFIHGPRDWDHFNKRGYQALIQGIVEGLGPLPD
jgi:hypothetical protein